MTASDSPAPRLAAKSFGLAFGHVKTFNPDTGFGFIRTTHDVDAFLRIQDLFGAPDEFRPGDLVEFTLYQGQRRWFCARGRAVAERSRGRVGLAEAGCVAMVTGTPTNLTTVGCHATANGKRWSRPFSVLATTGCCADFCNALAA